MNQIRYYRIWGHHLDPLTCVRSAINLDPIRSQGHRHLLAAAHSNKLIIIVDTYMESRFPVTAALCRFVLTREGAETGTQLWTRKSPEPARLFRSPRGCGHGSRQRPSGPRRAAQLEAATSAKAQKVETWRYSNGWRSSERYRCFLGDRGFDGAGEPRPLCF